MRRDEISAQFSLFFSRPSFPDFYSHASTSLQSLDSVHLHLTPEFDRLKASLT
jgi:hypothetical protein